MIKIKNFFFRTIGPISTKLGTKHPWVKGIKVCSNESVKFIANFILNIEIEPLPSDKLPVFHNRIENDWMLSLMRWTFLVT